MCAVGMDLSLVFIVVYFIGVRGQVGNDRLKAVLNDAHSAAQAAYKNDTQPQQAAPCPTR